MATVAAQPDSCEFSGFLRYEVRHENLSALARPQIGHRSQEFKALYSGLIPRLQQLLGTSGTTTTLAGIHLGLARYDRAQVDGIRIARPDLIDVVGRVRTMDRDRLAQHGCIGPQRADWVLPGAAILQAIMDCWPCAALTVADRGIRDGILRQLIERDGADRPRAS